MFISEFDSDCFVLAKPLPSSIIASSPSPYAAAIKYSAFNLDCKPPMSIAAAVSVMLAILEKKTTTTDIYRLHLTITPDDDAIIRNFTSMLHAPRPSLKTLLSIDGGGSDSTTFAKLIIGCRCAGWKVVMGIPLYGRTWKLMDRMKSIYHMFSIVWNWAQTAPDHHHHDHEPT